MKPSQHEPESYWFYRSRSLLYRTMANVLGIVVVIGVICIIFYQKYVDHTPVSDDFFEKWVGMAIIFGFGLFLMIGFFIKWLQISYNATKSIVFYSDSIAVGDEIILFSDIASIKILDVGRIAYEPFYGASIHLLNGEVKFIAEQFYNQSSLLFQRLEKVSREHLSERSEADMIPQLNQETKITERFSFNPLTSIDHLLFLSLLITLLFTTTKTIVNPTSPWYFTFFLILVSCFIYYFGSKVSHYLIIDEHNIEIKNSFLFGFSKVFRLNEIKGVVLHPIGMGRNMRLGTRIVLNNYRTYYYPSPFTCKKWKSLAEALQRRGVYVENRISV